MVKLRRRGEEARFEQARKSPVRYKQTYVLDAEGMLIAPLRTYNIKGQYDDDSAYTWVEEWEVNDDCLAVEVLCTNTSWGDTFSMIYMPPRPSIKQMSGVEELLSDFGLSLIGADPHQQTMAYVKAGIFSIDEIEA